MVLIPTLRYHAYSATYANLFPMPLNMEEYVTVTLLVRDI